LRLIGLAGWSGSGKTTLLTRLIPELASRGVAVSTLKHAHHEFDVDRPGKDSHAHRQAGARQVLVSSVDLVIIEGFKRDPHPKIEVFRAANAKPWLHPDDPAIIGIAADVAPPSATLPHLHLDDIAGIADLILARAIPLRG